MTSFLKLYGFSSFVFSNEFQNYGTQKETITNQNFVEERQLIHLVASRVNIRIYHIYIVI